MYQSGWLNDKEEIKEVIKQYVTTDTFIVCVGTDRCIGDSVAPFVGTFLKEAGFVGVVGTIDQPIHGTNLEEYYPHFPTDLPILAIDATVVFRVRHLWHAQLKTEPLRPGSGLGQNIGKLGNTTLMLSTAIETNNPNLTYQALCTASLSRIMAFARMIADAIMEAFPERIKKEMSSSSTSVGV